MYRDAAVLCLLLPPVLSSFNCFSQVDELKWSLVVQHHTSNASLSVAVTGAGPNVLTCLNRQQDANYRVWLAGDSFSEKYIHPRLHAWDGTAGGLLEAPPVFNYLIYGGRYRVEFASCDGGACGVPVVSDYINIQSELNPWCQQENAAQANLSNISILEPVMDGMSGLFEFRYRPCSSVQDYDRANVTLYESVLAEECWKHPLQRETVSVQTNGSTTALVTFQSPLLQGDHYYCVSVSLSHLSCRLEQVDPPSSCYLRSRPIWIHAKPAIARLIPFCTSHLACLWLYIVVVGGTILVLSLCLAVICVRCCDRRNKHKPTHDEVDFSGEVMNLTTLPNRRTWSQVHLDWEVGLEGTRRGKILLLYSPDTKLFKELQEALKSFLDLACHCDIYDLFDDALFDTIALDPSGWLEEFVNDKDVKIIIISSIGAHRRQLALQGQMPLNLPENSLLDGLFTSGLRFVSTYPGLASSGRVATARYEMLHLTEPGHSLAAPVGGNKEFLIPTHLHEIFCWVHQMEPLDLMGKPWVNYHLELQLLQDALKLVRRDRTIVGNSGSSFSELGGYGNGAITII